MGNSLFNILRPLFRISGGMERANDPIGGLPVIDVNINIYIHHDVRI